MTTCRVAERALSCALTLMAVLSLAMVGGASAQEPSRHAVAGMVLAVDRPSATMLVSHDDIAGVMPAMAMPFDVRDATQLAGLEPGMSVTFTLVLGENQPPYAEQVTVVRYQSVEQDPMSARRLRLLKQLAGAPPPEALAAGQAVPDFALTDHTGARVTLSQFRGRVVALNFIYTSCELTQFCFRVTNHFGVVARRFAAQAGDDLVLLTVTFDPARDSPEALRDYASQWKPDPRAWRFLTGGTSEIQRVCDLFGVDFFPDDGLMNHSLRTVIVDRQGALAATIEGNRYSAAQLGDLIDAALRR